LAGSSVETLEEKNKRGNRERQQKLRDDRKAVKGLIKEEVKITWQEAKAKAVLEQWKTQIKIAKKTYRGGDALDIASSGDGALEEADRKQDENDEGNTPETNKGAYLETSLPSTMTDDMTFKELLSNPGSPLYILDTVEVSTEDKTETQYQCRVCGHTDSWESHAKSHFQNAVEKEREQYKQDKVKNQMRNENLAVIDEALLNAKAMLGIKDIPTPRKVSKLKMGPHAKVFSDIRRVFAWKTPQEKSKETGLPVVYKSVTVYPDVNNDVN
jgi:hypothetical protein